MIQIFSDFDGTLTNQDTSVVLLDRFAPVDWIAIEEQMLSGQMDERTGFKEELKLIWAPDELLLETLEAEIHPAEGLAELIETVRERDWQMSVLSGGLIRFLEHLWRKWGYGDFPIFANDHRRNDHGCIEIIEAKTPRLREYCNHCKRWYIEEAKKRGSEVVYIGDGLTDFCPAEAAHQRYAKGNLLRHLQERQLEVIPFENLRQVAEDLGRKYS